VQLQIQELQSQDKAKKVITEYFQKQLPFDSGETCHHELQYSLEQLNAIEHV